MKVRDSGMPDEDMWIGFFDPAKVLSVLGLDRGLHDLVEFGCGYGTFTLAAAGIAAGTVHALDIEPEMVEVVRQKCAVVRFLLPVLPVGLALMSEDRGWDILNIIMPPAWIKIVLAVVALDFVIYLQHVLFHFLPILWRLHRMHHTDLNIDVTSGNRFHPVE